MLELIHEFLFGSGQYQMAVVPPGLIVGALGSVAGGLSSLFGGRRRRQEEKNSQRAFNTAQSQLDNFQFQNQYAGLENAFEDQTVNTQAANFQGQQADQSLAQGLDALLQSGGGGGSAQAIANAALQSKQGISADIQRQEQQNRQSRLAETSRLQQLEAQGADQLQQQQFAQVSDKYDRAGSRLQRAQEARQQATSALVGGITGAATVAGGAGVFGDKIQGFLGFGDKAKTQTNTNTDTNTNTNTNTSSNPYQYNSGFFGGGIFG